MRNVTVPSSLHTIRGRGGVLKRIDDAGLWGRIVLVEPSRGEALEVLGVLFDGNAEGQSGYAGGYSREHQSCLLNAGRSLVVESCKFYDCLGDGITQHRGTLKATHCKFENIFRGGIAMTSGGGLEIENCEFIKAGLAIETETGVVTGRVSNVTIKEGKCDLLCEGVGSNVLVENLRAERILVWNRGTLRIRNSYISGRATLRHPGDLEFKACQIGKAEVVMWNYKTEDNEQRLAFTGCLIGEVKTGNMPDGSIVSITGCTVNSAGTGVEIGFGGQVDILDTTIRAGTGLYLRNYEKAVFSISLDRVHFDVKHYWNNWADDPRCSVEHRDVTISGNANNFQTENDMFKGPMQYRGHRTIVANRKRTQEPGLPGDVLIVGNKRYRCIKPSMRAATWEEVSAVSGEKQAVPKP